MESCFDAVSAFMSAIRYRLKKHLSLAASDFEKPIYFRPFIGVGPMSLHEYVWATGAHWERCRLRLHRERQLLDGWLVVQHVAWMGFGVEN